MIAYITNKTLNGDMYEVKNILGDYVKWYKVNDVVVFECNYVAAPRIAYSNFDDDFIFDLGSNGIVSFINKHYPNDTVQAVSEEPYSQFKQSVKKDYELKHVSFIENWSQVIVYPDGSFDKRDYPLKPYSVPLKDAYDNLYNLLVKYKRGVELLTQQNNFIPTITGGLDTRCLTVLWKNIYKGNDFYIREVKQDNNNRVDLGWADLQVALKVAKKFNLTKHTSDRQCRITLSGMYTESTRGMYNMDVNDDRFIYKFIQHQIRGNTLLLPFADDLFLQIKQPKKGVFRCLMMLLFASDMLDIECIGTQKLFEKYNYGPYSFFDEYKDVISDAKEIIKYWGEEKCERLKNI